MPYIEGKGKREKGKGKRKVERGKRKREEERISYFVRIFQRYESGESPFPKSESFQDH